MQLIREGDSFFKAVDGGEKVPISPEVFNELASRQKLSTETGGTYREDGGVDLDNGPQIDENRLYEYVKNYRVHSELQGFLNAAEPASLKYKLLRREKLANMAAHYHAIGEHDLLETVINSYRELDHQGRYEAGFNTVSDEDFHKEIEDSLSYVRTLKQLYDGIQDSIPNQPKHLQRKIELRKLGNRITTLEEFINSNSPQDDTVEALAKRKALDTLLKDTIRSREQAYLRGDIKAYDEQSSKFESLTQALKDLPKPSALPTQAQLRASKTRAEAIEAIPILEEMKAQFNELMDYTKEFKAPTISEDSRASRKFIFDSATTKDQLDVYLTDEVSRRLRTQRTDNALREDFAQYLDSLGDNESLDEILQALKDYKPSLTPEQGDALKNKIYKEVADLELAEDADWVEIDEDFEEATQIAQAIQSRSKLTLSNPDAAANFVDSLVNLPTDLTSDDLKALALDELYSSSRALVASYLDDPDNFTSEKSATAELVKVSKLAEFYPAPDSEYLLETLKLALDTAIKNLQDRDAAIRELSELRTSMLSNILRLPSILPFIESHAKAEKLLPIIDTHPEIVLNYLRDNQAVLDKLNELESAIPQAKNILNVEQYFLEGLDELNDYKVTASGAEGFDASRDSAIYKYRKNFNLARFLKEAAQQDRGDSKTSKESLNAFLDTYTQLKSIRETRDILTTDISPREVDNSYAAAVEQFKAQQLVPSDEQRHTIRQALRWIFSKFSPTSLPFANIAYFRGPAGSGKTRVVVPYILRAAGFGPSDVVLAGTHETAVSNLSEVFPSSIHPSYTVDDLIEALNSNSLGKSKIIVLDEAGYMTPEALNKLATAFASYNSKTEYPTKLLLLGDPNQLAAIKGVRPAIDNDRDLSAYYGAYPALSHIGNMKRLDSLTTAFRSDIDAITDVQEVFRNAEYYPVDALQESTNHSTSDVGGLKGVVVRASGMVEALVQSHRLNPSRTKLVITDSFLTQEAVLKALALDKQTAKDRGIEILKPHEAQGLTRDEVYVDLKYEPIGQLYLASNKEFYTATTRPKQLLWINGFNASSRAVDPSLEIKETANKAQKAEMLSRNVDKERELKDIYKSLDSKEEATTSKKEEGAPKEESTGTEGTTTSPDNPSGIEVPKDAPTPLVGTFEVSNVQGSAFRAQGELEDIRKLLKDSPAGLPIHLIRQKDDKYVRV